MNKIIIAPDSFKGTMSAIEICQLAEPIAKQYFPESEIVSVPIADGGEGTIDSFLYAKSGQKITLITHDPLGEKIRTNYAFLNDSTAVIEMAESAGLPLMNGNYRVMETNTYGVGEQILDAIKRGAKKIVIGLGGSATNDAGCGALAALGAKFFDETQKEFIPTGGTLKNITQIEIRELYQNIEDIEFLIMSDIDNPLYGKNGASYVFGPQKGASPREIECLDHGLRHFANAVKLKMHVDLQSIKGGGAAGGMGAGFSAFLNSSLKMGIDIILDELEFDDLLKDTRFVVSGEGRLDGQSARGKVLAGLGNRCSKQNVSLFAIVGDIADGAEKIYSHGVTGIFSINRLAIPFSVARARAKEDFAFTLENLMRVLSVYEKK